MTRVQDGLPPFLVACWHGHTGIVRAMLTSGKVGINDKDSVRPILMIIALLTPYSVLCSLLQHKRSCLLWASANNHLDTVRVLLANATVNVTALDVSQHYCHCSWFHLIMMPPLGHHVICAHFRQVSAYQSAFGATWCKVS